MKKLIGNEGETINDEYDKCKREGNIKSLWELAIKGSNVDV